MPLRAPLTEPLTPEVNQFLTDLYEGFADDRRFCQESLTIEAKSGELIPFVWNKAQERLGAAVKRQRDAGKPIRLIILKSRRAGFSTGVAALLFKHTAFYPGQKALIVAHENAASANLFRMYDTFRAQYQPFGMVEDVFDGIVLEKHDSLQSGTETGSISWPNRSSVQIATARNLQGKRSFGFRRIHLSEFAFYPDAKTLMTGLMQTVPRDPDTIVVIESTANGMGGEFYDQWMRVTDPDKESDWIPLFFPWHEDAENSITVQGDRSLFQKSLSAEEIQLQSQYNLTLDQLNWRRWCIENNCFGDERRFRQEYPGNPQEAFLETGNPVFEPRHINRFVSTQGLIGDLEHTEYAGQREMFFRVKERGGLRLFRRPEKGRNYVIGADTASGLDANEGRGTSDPDYSVGQIFDADTGEQVAIFRQRLVETQFAETLWALGAWYNWAYIVPEVQGGYGRAMLDRLIMSVMEPLLRPGYPMERIYSRRNETVPSKPRYEDLGWQTTPVTRPQLISTLNSVFYDGAIIVNDPVTLMELRTFVKDKLGKEQAQAGRHDDTVIALALAVVGIQRAPRLQLIQGGQASTGLGPEFYGQSARRRVG